MSGSIETMPTTPRCASPKWTLPSRPRCDAARAPEVVGEDRGRRGALDEVRAEVADQRADRVVGAEREGRADAVASWPRPS
jgi:hypothetical protein